MKPDTTSRRSAGRSHRDHPPVFFDGLLSPGGDAEAFAPLPSSRAGLMFRVALLCVVMLACCLFSRQSQGMGRKSRVGVGQLKYSGGNWKVRPTGMRRLLWEAAKRTSVETNLKFLALRADSPKLFRFPLLFLTGDSAFPSWPTRHIKRLRRHLSAGGTLFVDSAEARAGGGFDRSARRLVRRLFPSQKLSQISSKHTLLKSFYLIRRFGGRKLVRPYLETVERDDRAVIIFSLNDLAGAWERNSFGSWTHAVVPGGRRQREGAFRLGINILMYALCGNYKRDQVHAPFIMRRRKR